MCRQMAPPQNELVSKIPSEEVRGMSSKTALASSPAPMTAIGRLKPIFATWSGGKSPNIFAEPARIMMPPINPCSTQPAMVFQFRFTFMAQSPSVCGSVLHDSYLNHVAKKLSRSLRKTGKRMHPICKPGLWQKEVQGVPAPSRILRSEEA